MSTLLPFPTDPQSLAIAGIGLVSGVWLLILRSGALAERRRARRDHEKPKAA